MHFAVRPDDVRGVPVGLQVMGQRHQEERILAIVHAIHSALAVYIPAQV